MTLGEHLDELRSRLIKAIAALVIGAIVCFIFVRYIVAFILWPVFLILEKHGHAAEIKAFSPPETIITDLKVAFIVGFILTAPYSLAQIWGFIATGLYPHERKWVQRFVPVSIGLFFTGAAFMLVVVSPLLLDFLLSYRTDLPNVAKIMPPFPVLKRPEQKDIPGLHEVWPDVERLPAFHDDPPEPPEGIPWVNLRENQIRFRIGDRILSSPLREVERQNRVTPDLRLGETVPFILHLAAAFGIGFQVPVVVILLSRLGIVDARTMGRSRRYVWFGMAVCSAILTPPDILSMMSLLGPMALLFEIGLLFARAFERNRDEEALA